MEATQCKMARAGLGWSLTELAERSGVSISSIAKFERGESNLIRANLAALQSTLEAAGVEFQEPDAGTGSGVGVRLAHAGAGAHQ